MNDDIHADEKTYFEYFDKEGFCNLCSFLF